jgi:hypothetical protein
MEDRETQQMHKYGESKTTRIMVTYVTSLSGMYEISGNLVFVEHCTYRLESKYAPL